jgi:hypothetical protein
VLAIAGPSRLCAVGATSPASGSAAEVVTSGFLRLRTPAATAPAAAADLPLWQRYERACDYLEDDLDSGYVRVLQEMIAAGWSNRGVCEAVRELLAGWFHLLAGVVREAGRRHGPLGPFTAEELAALVGSAFLGAEELLLLGFDRQLLPIRSALRRVGIVLRQLEEGPARPGRTSDARLPASP